ncbi:Peptidoglycan-binding domain 1 protein [Methylobacterium sp. 4-46]|uniref:peptidoglycan-binding domain-containing protein n=1 Tax=unclassified Methylobacterium TaxID=2615210 RepID=UPI000152DF86|nr:MULTISPECIES: peptidoglycan-binding domain-containing protein [Methylobacterium]ACA15650.1 Peptidoglycan-binding domain 1 protein [Methylobacterium sp. 4-46]WFT81362.1 peptidoglycan-binding domain-containing protein [Methylobacterium nodulans]WFT81409.1 peptidoglycan-binding domain-containing protein [Methylobacterium nodulans]
MPEAPARPRDPDLTIVPEARPVPRPPGAAPRVRRPAAAPAALPEAGGPRGRFEALLRHPAAIAGGLLTLAATAAVAVNALSFQNGRHPAPLFAQAPAKSPANAPTKSAAKPDARPPRPAPHPAEAPQDGIGEILRGDAQVTASVAPHDAPPRPASGSQKSLASLPPPPPRPRGEAAPAASAKLAALRAPETRAAEAKPAARRPAGPDRGEAPHPDPQVAFAQKALVKLGYGPLAVDGRAGPATRAAIARFERERRLPGSPEVASRTLKELASRSGLKPD